MRVRLDCGHVAEVPGNPHIRPGGWLSCWALMWPGSGCQAQRKVMEVAR
jgi:hypothetical protein